MRREAPLRIFLGHTSELREHPKERSYVAAAESAVMRAGHAVSNMAYFAARDTEPADYSAAEVQRADVFVGIIGMRYGSPVRDRPELSYTELEFEAAMAAGIPRLLLLVKEDAVGLPAADQAAEHRGRQEAFRRRLQDAGVTIAWVSTPAETELRLFQALVELRGRLTQPRQGILAGQTRPSVPMIAPSTLCLHSAAAARVDNRSWTFEHPDADIEWWAEWMFDAACDIVGQSRPAPAEVINARLRTGGVSPGMVSAFRRGDAFPSFPAGLAALVAAGADIRPIAEFLTFHRPGGRLEDVDRRQFLGAMAGFVGLAGPGSLDPEPWERLAYAMSHPKRIDRGTLAQLEQVTIALEQLELQVSPRVLIGPVKGHLNTVADLLAAEPPSGMRAQLLSLAGESAGLVGWLASDQANLATSADYFRTGLEAARDAGDAGLGAYLLGGAACIASHREHPEQRLATLSNQGFGFNQTDGTPDVRSWLATVQAEAYVSLGDEKGCRRALTTAREAMSHVDDANEQQPRPRVPFFDETRLAAEEGLCLSRLGKAREAQELLEASIQRLEPNRVKPRARLLAALGMAYAQQGEVEAASRVASEALHLARMQGVEPNLQDVQELRKQLDPWKHTTAVRELDERMNESA
jgi:tetratricopeptide (TPR) repeat protein